jgi:anti-sigma B factor antagonist
MDDLTVTSAQDGNVVVLNVRGEIDAATAAILDQRLREADDRSTAEVVVDFGGVDFIDSSGLSVLVATHKRLRNREATLVVVNPQAATRRLFQIAGLDAVLTIR